MRRSVLTLFWAATVLSSAWWLIGYGRAIWPFVVDGIRDQGFSFLNYPQIKWYTKVDPISGQMSEMKIDWFSVSDGPTGVVYAHRHFPCWIVTLGAAINLLGSAVAVANIWSRSHVTIDASQERSKDLSRSGT